MNIKLHFLQGDIKMKIFSLNVNHFLYQYELEDSFDKYYKEIAPDIAIIQECKYSQLNSNYNIILPKSYSKSKIDNRVHLTLALCKSDEYIRDDSAPIKLYDYRFVKIRNENKNISLTGVHIPSKDRGKEDEYNDLLSAIIKSDSKIICGDFNASSKNDKSDNYKFLERLILQEGYVDLWSKGIENHKAFYINYKGETIKAEKGKFYRTFAGNTHIDYILGKSNLIDLKKIVIDMRTLAFTDHCCIIAEIEVAE